MTYSAEVLADSPYGYYKLDESSGATTAVDSSGSSRDLTHAAGAVAFGTAPLLIGSTTCGTFDTNDELAFSNTNISSGGLSLEAWVKTTNSTTARGIMGWHNSSNVSTKRFTLEMLASGIVQATVICVSSGTAVTLTSTTAVNDGSPHHVVLTLSAMSGGSIVLYVDGASQDTDTAPSGTVVAANRMRLGGIGASGTRWSGDIDEAAFYNSALTSTRVTAHYDAGSKNVTTFAGSFPAWTSNVQISAVTAVQADAVFPAWTSDIELQGDVGNQVTFAGSFPAWTSDLELDANPFVEMAAIFPSWTSDIELDDASDLAMAGSFPAWTSAIVLQNAFIVQGVAQELGFYVGYGELAVASDLVLTIADDTLEQAPTLLTVDVVNAMTKEENAGAQAEVEFWIDGLGPVYIAEADSDGQIYGLSVPVSETYGAAGTHTLEARSDNREPSSATFTIAEDPAISPTSVGADDDPVLVPAAEYAPGKYKWVLQDLMPGGLGSWVMPINPASASPMQVRKQYEVKHTTAQSGQFHLWEAHVPPTDFQFAGYGPDEDFYNQLRAYAGLNRRFWLIDHRNRAWTVTFTRVDLRLRKRQRDDTDANNDWAHDYTVNGLVFSQDWAEPA